MITFIFVTLTIKKRVGGAGKENQIVKELQFVTTEYKIQIT